MLGGGLGTEDALAPLHRIQVNLKDPLLVEPELEHPRDGQLLALAQVVLLGRQEQVLGQLLGDGRPAAHDAPALLVALPGGQHRVEVVAGMIDEIRVLAGDDRALQVPRDVVVAHPLALDPATPEIHAAEPPALGAQEGRGRRVHDLPRGNLEEEVQLHGQHARHQAAGQIAEPAQRIGRAAGARRRSGGGPLARQAGWPQRAASAWSPARNSARTGTVLGRTPRQL
ncbi:hypothetical protein D3C81_1092080 [compost metagenome]